MAGCGQGRINHGCGRGLALHVTLALVDQTSARLQGLLVLTVSGISKESCTATSLTADVAGNNSAFADRRTVGFTTALRCNHYCTTCLTSRILPQLNSHARNIISNLHLFASHNYSTRRSQSDGSLACKRLLQILTLRER